ncbi:MAG: OsmC family protein [Gemmatimonadota bacterium]|nr:OsmC family protein [Gemmatimonadota bacterium]
MKITLLGDDAIRLEPTSGALTIEAASAEMGYSPFHMLASALASCTFSVLYSWATHKDLTVDDLVLDVHWKFGDDPHRVSDIGVNFNWPSLPAERVETAKRVAALCTVHATLMHPPKIDIAASSAKSAIENASPARAAMRGDPAAAPEPTVVAPAAE